MNDNITNAPMRQGFLQLPRAILKYNISDGAKIKFSLLFDLARTRGFAWPTLDQLAEMTNGSRRAATVQLNELLSAGLISKVRNGRRIEYRVVHILHSSNRLVGHNVPSTSAQNALVSNVREQEQENKNKYTTADGDSMSKIVSPIDRTPPGSEEDRPVRISPGKRSPTSADNLIYWYGSLPFGNRDDSNAAKNCWAKLIAKYNGNTEKVKAVVIEARKNKHRLVNEKYPKFTIQSVLFYVTYLKPDENDAPENEPINEIAERKIKECMNAEGVLDANRISHLISMFNVRREQVQRAFNDSECNVLFNAVGDEAWGKSIGTSTAVSG